MSHPADSPLRLLGLIGGASWQSTQHYYALLNRMTQARLGGRHSARLLLWSLDFEPIAEKQDAGRWHDIEAELVDAAHRLEDAGAEALMMCVNTFHIVADEVAAAIGIPLIHIADVTAEAVKAKLVKRPLLLGTRFTMEKPFYVDRLARHGLEAIVPDAEDRARVNTIIFEELVKGVFRPESRDVLLEIADKERRERGADGVILGCTELGLVAPPDVFELPAFDTAEIHAAAGIDFALGRMQ